MNTQYKLKEGNGLFGNEHEPALRSSTSCSTSAQAEGSRISYSLIFIVPSMRVRSGVLHLQNHPPNQNESEVNQSYRNFPNHLHPITVPWAVRAVPRVQELKADHCRLIILLAAVTFWWKIFPFPVTHSANDVCSKPGAKSHPPTRTSRACLQGYVCATTLYKRFLWQWTTRHPTRARSMKHYKLHPSV